MKNSFLFPIPDSRFPMPDALILDDRPPNLLQFLLRAFGVFKELEHQPLFGTVEDRFDEVADETFLSLFPGKFRRVNVSPCTFFPVDQTFFEHDLE